MARRIAEEDLQAIIDAVSAREGATAQEIARALGDSVPLRTLQYRLKQLVDADRLVKEGKGPSARYHIPKIAEAAGMAAGEARAAAQAVALSKEGAAIQDYVRQPLTARNPVGYDRAFLDAYRPNESAYLSEKERAQLHRIGTAQMEAQPAGTYAKQILNRLLIDLSWNSSRLEGNTYSLLDTRNLIDFGVEAEGKEHVEAQMILNHKDAIEFLVSEVDGVGFNRYTIQNLHAMLANNLLPDPYAAGRLRHIAVGIDGSVFHPLEVPQLIEECFDQFLATAAAISDPFERAFFVMVQLPYLQPFDDVNKRVARLATNIPLINANLAPLSFTEVPRQVYLEAMLGIYELNKVDLLRDVFLWAYERSAARYAAVQQSLGKPDPFRLRHRAALREVIGKVVRGTMNRKQAAAFIAGWTGVNIDATDHDRFREIAEGELLGLHEGNFARYQIRPSEFAAWRQVWDARS